MEINSEEVAQPSNSNICKGCKKEIEKGAKRCHHCGEYQNRLRNGLNILVSISSLGVLLLLIWQLSILNKQTEITKDQVKVAKDQVNVAKEQVEETKKKRIEAKVVLDEARNVKANAESVLRSANAALKKSDSVLSDAKAKVYQVSSKVNDIDKEVQKADNSLKTFTKRQNKLSEEVGGIKTELTAEVKKLKERNEIVALEDKAIANGDTASYEELKRIANKLPRGGELYDAVISSISRVKKFYINMSRVRGLHLTKYDGTEYTNDELSTYLLGAYLLGDSDWKNRNVAANLLRKRKEKGVPDKLIIGMKDKNLNVRCASIRSFEALTHYKIPDVLEYNELIKWWKEHKEEWESKLPK